MPLRILNHEESFNGIRLSLGAWTGISCNPGEVRLVLKLELPKENSLLGDIKNYASVKKYDGSRKSLKEAIILFCSDDTGDKDLQQGMAFLYTLFR